MDYDGANLSAEGSGRVNWPRVVGAGWEKAAKLSDTYGPWGVNYDDVKYVTFYHVERRGTVDVALSTLDKTLCLNVNKGIQRMLQKYDLFRVGAPNQRLRNRQNVFVKDDDGNVFSHDLVVQKIGVDGLWSVEVKCVNRSSAAGFLKARASQRWRALKLWRRIGETPRPDAWKGRLLVLVWLHDNRATFDIKVDIYARSQSN
jgi:hypothetical protein